MMRTTMSMSFVGAHFISRLAIDLDENGIWTNDANANVFDERSFLTHCWLIV